MPTRRMVRVNELLLREISQYVLERQHPDMGFVTFTGVEVTEDLKDAKVFYSVLGDDAQKEMTFKALKSLEPELHRDMRKLESLRYIPNLVFHYDETPAKAARVLELLEEIHKEEAPPEGGQKPSGKANSRKKK